MGVYRQKRNPAQEERSLAMQRNKGHWRHPSIEAHDVCGWRGNGPQVGLQLRELLEQKIEGQTNKDENLVNCLTPSLAPSIFFYTKRKEERGLNLEPMWDYLERRVVLSCKRAVFFSVITTNGGSAGQCLLQTITAIPREACKIRASRIGQMTGARETHEQCTT